MHSTGDFSRQLENMNIMKHNLLPQTYLLLRLLASKVLHDRLPARPVLREERKCLEGPNSLGYKNKMLEATF